MGHLSVKAPHNIIILRALQLGDLLCTVPAFRALRAAYPEAHIALAGLSWAESFVRRFSQYLNEFIEFPGWPGLPEQKPQLERVPGFLQNMQERRFDLALQMQGSGLLTNPLISLFGARQAAGFFTPGHYRPNPRLFAEYPTGQHEIRTFLHLMEFLGIPARGEDLEFHVFEEERQEYKSFRAAHNLEPGRYICLHPGARFSGRRLPPELFAEVGDALVKMGYQVVITGSETERELAGEVTASMTSPALNAAGLTSLGVMAQLLVNAALLLSNDTGVSHLATALKTPSVVLFTVSDPSRWRPLNHNLHRIIPDARQASLNDILAEASDLLSSERAALSEPIKGNYAGKLI
jgi:ADP-heptose:LPS heptosyltransferase